MHQEGGEIMPEQEYRILITATFTNQADRDAWLTKIKTAWANLKIGLNPPKAAHITGQDYFISTDLPPEVLP